MCHHCRSAVGLQRGRSGTARRRSADRCWRRSWPGGRGVFGLQKARHAKTCVFLESGGRTCRSSGAHLGRPACLGGRSRRRCAPVRPLTPFAAALVTVIHAGRPDAEPLAWMPADMLVAVRLKWTHLVPLPMAERPGLPPARRSRPCAPRRSRLPARRLPRAGRGGGGYGAARRRKIARRADMLPAAASKVRTKGQGPPPACSSG